MKEFKLSLFMIILLSTCILCLAEGKLSTPSESDNDSLPNARLDLVAEKLVSPIEFVSAADNTGRMFIVDQTGMIEIMIANGTVLDEPFLDARDRMVDLSPAYDERGLLGLAFHPDFAKNGRLFVLYSAPRRTGAPADWSCTNYISEFAVSKDNPNKTNMSSEKILLQIDKPQMNHNGGTIAFGPDGFLYVPLGDGGGAGDTGIGHQPDGNGQNTSVLLGKILRIDINSKSPGIEYGMPPDNPFVDEKEFRPEIFAYGLRNPYRISFDSGGNHSLFAADAGQDLWEEVDVIKKGGNYGWNIKEGTHCFDPENRMVSLPNCSAVGAVGEPLLDPIIEYGHDFGTVVIGGYVYRGKQLPDFEGSYIFGDWSKFEKEGDGSLLVAKPSNESRRWNWKEIWITNKPNGRIGSFIRSFGQDNDGEIYVLTSDVSGPSGNTGKVYKIVP
jgi:glucose/arabinose dehydrogenase